MIIRRASSARAGLAAAEGGAAAVLADVSSGLVRLSLRHPGSGSVSLEVAGEIDLSSAEAFRDCLLAAVEVAGCRELVVDLARVEFFGAAGIGALAEAHARARDREVMVCLAGVSRIARRALMVAGAADCFDTWSLGGPADVHPILPAQRPRP